MVKSYIRCGCYKNRPKLKISPDSHLSPKIIKTLNKIDKFVDLCDDYLLENRGYWKKLFNKKFTYNFIKTLL